MTLAEERALLTNAFALVVHGTEIDLRPATLAKLVEGSRKALKEAFPRSTVEQFRGLFDGMHEDVLAAVAAMDAIGIGRA